MDKQIITEILRNIGFKLIFLIIYQDLTKKFDFSFNELSKEISI